MNIQKTSQAEKRVEQYSPLHITCSSGDLTVTTQLLDQGYNVNLLDSNGNGALHWAAKKGTLEIVELLVAKHGAQMNSQNIQGWSPLHFSIKYGNDPVSLYLLSQGCDPNILDMEGISPMHMACAVGNMNLVHTLFNHGAWLEIEDAEGDTPLHYAIRENQIDIIKWLLMKGADQNHPNVDLESPLDLVEEFGEPSLVSIFEEYANIIPDSLSSGISGSSEKSRLSKLRTSNDSYWKEPSGLLGQSTDSMGW